MLSTDDFPLKGSLANGVSGSGSTYFNMAKNAALEQVNNGARTQVNISKVISNKIFGQDLFFNRPVEPNHNGTSSVSQTI